MNSDDGNASPRYRRFDRCDYEAIVDRPAFRWPGNKRVALYFALNVEHFELGTRHAHTPAGKQSGPDYRNFAWREYGLRVGFWRILDCFASHGVPLCHLLNSQVVREYPRIAEEIKRRGHEVIAHGRSNSEHVVDMTVEEEEAMISEATTVLEETFERKVRGWLGPWIAESDRTLDLLAQRGYEYVLDLSLDDQPVPLRTQSGSIHAMPYSIELNDTPALVARQQVASSFEEMFVDQLEMYLQVSAMHPVVMAVPLHTFVFGQPFRLKYLHRMLERLAEADASEALWITTPNAIMDAYLEVRRKQANPPG